MRFVFRADASREIGSGHVMRSSVLAEEAISRGYDCIFVGKISDLEWVTERVGKLGFSQIVSDGALFSANHGADLLILDSYTIPVSESFITRSNWKRVLSICDEITPIYESDIELRPSLVELKSKNESSRLLSGPNYVLIRKGITKSENERTRANTLKVLIVGGGSDPFGFVDALAELLSEANLNLEVHAFTNVSLPENSKVKFIRHPIGPELDRIANDFDVVFTTASTSSLEFIAREIPAGIVCAVDNQKDYYEQLGKMGYASQIGIYNSQGRWEFNLRAIMELLESDERRNSLKDATKSLIDLKGAARVIDTLVLLSGNPTA